MKNTILSLLFVTAFACELVKTSIWAAFMMRCENDEVICYVYSKGQGGGLSCKFKETEK